MTTLRGLPVLVTGADGFIGSHLAERLVAEGADVRVLCLYTSEGTHGWLEDLPEGRRESIDVRLGDVRDAGFMRDIIGGRQLVFHLAAVIAIPYSYLAPRTFVETNVLGTQNVLDAVRASGCRMINTSTSEVYGTPHEVPIRETHPLRGQSPYAASKIAADKLCEAYALSFDTRVATLRPFNTFGPRQSLRAVIPTILTQLLAGSTELRLGSLSPRRDFTYVTDTVDGFIRAAQVELDPGEVVHLGTGTTVSIAELVQLCQRLVGTEATLLSESERMRPATSEVDVLLSDPSYAAKRLGWSPATGLEEGLTQTVQWLKRRNMSIDKASRYHR